MRYALILLLACGRSEAPHDRDWPSVNGNDAPLPSSDLAVDDSPSGISPLATSFKGSISELRIAPNLKNGLRVKISRGVVFAINGGGDWMYVSDPNGMAGLEVQRCLGADLDCKKDRPAFGASFSLSGTLAVAREGTLSLTNVKAELLPDEPIDLTPLSASPADLERGHVTGNEWAQASYVGVVNDDLWAELEVVDVEPADEKNGAFPESLDRLCGIANLAKPEVQAELEEKRLSCCPSGVGPKYGNVHLKEKKTGKIIALGTGNYRDIDFSGWPCGVSDLDKALRVGDVFQRLAGVFSVKRGAAVLSPTRSDDYVLVRH